MQTIDDFYHEGFLDKVSNATFISLIPKREGADEITEFRPISLAGSMHKIISKILAGRMRDVLTNTTFPNQSAFIGGRQSVDSILVANECIDKIIKEDRILCKLDMEKAYNKVN